MRHPGAFKIAHRPRPLRNDSSARHADGCAHSTVESGATHDPTDDPNPASDLDEYIGPLLASDARSQRVLESLRNEILEACVDGNQNLRIRLVFREPREIFRLELELPSLGYQRTTLLDRDALEQLLATDEVRAVVRTAELGL